MKAWYSKEIDRLYLQMYPMLFEYARSSLSNDALAEEAVQDTFVIACQKPEAVCNSPNPEGWLVNTLKNVLSNTIRSQNIARRILLDYFASNVNDLSMSSDRVGLEILYDDVADLEEFKLIKERAVDGKSYLEMAQERGISVKTCHKRVERAKKVLQKKIQL
jgi:RNA polymerase sigma-70 factor (ECF subfamily)